MGATCAARPLVPWIPRGDLEGPRGCCPHNGRKSEGLHLGKPAISKQTPRKPALCPEGGIGPLPSGITKVRRTSRDEYTNPPFCLVFHSAQSHCYKDHEFLNLTLGELTAQQSRVGYVAGAVGNHPERARPLHFGCNHLTLSYKVLQSILGCFQEE